MTISDKFDMTEMTGEFASVRDAQWLIENGHKTLDPVRFSDWVTRKFDAGKPEHVARRYVADKMIQELEGG